MPRKGYVTMGTGSFVLAMAVAAAFAFVGIWDAIALWLHGPEETVSAIVIGWSRQTPFIPFLAGFIAGHVFFPIRIH